ncbi:hypothetical protein F3Y22_tig00002011pilonHSYRG00001 [Hibiscus syriacus]|uniref:Uncharacterized protein n=1 Tax=Hibiscus syriacus TaxID=106335 RepID=A0A6A3CZ60_HIBSY|nr:hypothetical protein F3Y22_tig00002011pilonHSYRG00001 [Hibiscus syriacus]
MTTHPHTATLFTFFSLNKGEDWVKSTLHRLTHGGQVPNQGLRIIPCGANVTRAMGCPRYGIDTSLMPLELNYRQCRETDIQNNNLSTIHNYSGHVSRVLLVPPQSYKRSIRLRTLINNSRMLLVAKVKNPNGPISRNRSKNTNAAPGDIINLLIVGNKLGIHRFPLDIPYSTGRIDGGGADSLGLRLIPVEGGKRAAKLTVLIAIKERLEVDAGVIIGDSPDAEEVGGGCEKIGFLALLVGDEDGLGRRLRMVEGEVWVGPDLAIGVIELDNLEAISVLLEKAGDGETVFLVAADTPVHGVDVPRGLVSVYFRSFLLLIGTLRVGIAASGHLRLTLPLVSCSKGDTTAVFC